MSTRPIFVSVPLQDSPCKKAILCRTSDHLYAALYAAYRATPDEKKDFQDNFSLINLSKEQDFTRSFIEISSISKYISKYFCLLRDANFHWNIINERNRMQLISFKIFLSINLSVFIYSIVFKFYSMSSNRRGIEINKFCDNFYRIAVWCQIVQFA